MVVEGLFVRVRRGAQSWADLARAGVWEERHLVAKENVWERGRRAIEVAERKAAAAEVAGFMAVDWCGWYNLGNRRECSSGLR